MHCATPFERAQHVQPQSRPGHLEFKQVPIACKARPDRIHYEWHEQVNSLVKELGRDGWIPEFATDAETLYKAGLLTKTGPAWKLFGPETWTATVRFRRLVPG